MATELTKLEFARDMYRLLLSADQALGIMCDDIPTLRHHARYIEFRKELTHFFSAVTTGLLV